MRRGDLSDSHFVEWMTVRRRRMVGTVKVMMTDSDEEGEDEESGQEDDEDMRVTKMMSLMKVCGPISIN